MPITYQPSPIVDIADLRRLFSKIIVGLLFLIISNFAFAQWVGIASSEDRGGYSVYVDPDTKESTGETVNFWFLYDFKRLQKTPVSSYLSYEIQLEINCNKQMGRILGFIDYLEPMGAGKPIRTSSEVQNWTSLNPFVKDGIIWRIACPSHPTASDSQRLLGSVIRWSIQSIGYSASSIPTYSTPARSPIVTNSCHISPA